MRSGHHVGCSGAEIRIAKQDDVPTIAVACTQSRTVLAETGSGGTAAQAMVGIAQATVCRDHCRKSTLAVVACGRSSVRSAVRFSRATEGESLVGSHQCSTLRSLRRCSSYREAVSLARHGALRRTARIGRTDLAHTPRRRPSLEVPVADHEPTRGLPDSSPPGPRGPMTIPKAE